MIGRDFRECVALSENGMIREEADRQCVGLSFVRLRAQHTRRQTYGSVENGRVREDVDA